jgi:hypothetical protein
MAITNIIQKLSSFIQNKLSIPLIPIPAIMLICSTLKRPGVSPMLITARTINRLGSEVGAHIGVNIDGSPNMMNQLCYIITDEIVKAIKLEGKVEIAIPPGGITSLGFGANSGGMVSVTSSNIMPVSGSGIIR